MRNEGSKGNESPSNEYGDEGFENLVETDVGEFVNIPSPFRSELSSPKDFDTLSFTEEDLVDDIEFSQVKEEDVTTFLLHIPMGNEKNQKPVLTSDSIIRKKIEKDIIKKQEKVHKDFKLKKSDYYETDQAFHDLAKYYQGEPHRLSSLEKEVLKQKKEFEKREKFVERCNEKCSGFLRKSTSSSDFAIWKKGRLKVVVVDGVEHFIPDDLLNRRYR